jgi:succinate dehydrogenase / fumarate reductase flavoprotein subunit
MHGSNRLGGNSLSDLLVFGRRAGLGASEYVAALSERPKPPQDAVDEAAKMALAPYDAHENPENPYTLHAELQQSMNDLVGIIRKADEVEQALVKLDELRGRLQNVAVEGGRVYNPGWHLAIDMRNMLLVSECVAKAALQRTESRGGHTRDDHPEMDANWRNTLLVCRTTEVATSEAMVPRVTVVPEQQSQMRPDLLGCFELSELEKYYTDEELTEHPERKA